MNNSSNEQSANEQFSSNGSYSSNENPPKRIEKINKLIIMNCEKLVKKKYRM